MIASILVPVLPFLGVVGLAGLLGDVWFRMAGGLVGGTSQLFNLWLTILGGLATVYLWLLALTFAGISWRASTVLAPLILLAIGGQVVRRRPVGSPMGRRAPDLGDLVTLAALAILGVLLVNACLTMSDFVFHWGFKAHRWWLGQGIDFAALTEPWNIPRHPDYPGLVPGLFVVTAILHGGFAEVPAIAWTLFFVAGCMVAARAALHTAIHDPWLRQATLAIIATTVAFMTISYRLGGSPDLLMAAAMASTIAILVAPPDDRHDAPIGLITAVAVGTKVEGTPFAALAITVYLVRRYQAGANETGPRVTWPMVARTVLPSLAVALPWWWLIAHHHLSVEARGGGFALDRFGAIANAVGSSLVNPAWHGLGLVLVLLPIAWFVNRTRAAAIVLTGQIAFYVWVYLDTPFDAVNLVHTSAVRLMLHVWPATMALVAIALDHFASQNGGAEEGVRPARSTGTILG